MNYNQQQLHQICQQSDINYLGLFGSTARGQAKPDSDVDLVVDFNHTKSLFELSRIKQQLEAVFNKPVDLVIRKNIKPIIKPYIEQDLQSLYEQN